MRIPKNTWILLLLTMESCGGQTKYFQPIGVTDSTKELSGRREWIFLKSYQRIDGYTRIGDSIFGGEIACNIEPLKNIDVKSYRVLPGTKYAKDTNYVYYPLEILCKDGEDCGVCYYNRIIVENANPATFRYLDKDYATDGNNVYFRGKLMEGADAPTFKVIDGPQFFYFATDSRNVYEHETVFKEADPATFFYDEKDTRNIISEYSNKYIIGDKSKEWQFIPPHQITEIIKNKHNR